MAGTATEHAGVYLMTEGDRPGIRDFKCNILGRVAGRTAVLDVEGLIAVMAGPTGFAFFHVLHSEF